jgi:hypothetical protein
MNNAFSIEALSLYAAYDVQDAGSVVCFVDCRSIRG